MVGVWVKAVVMAQTDFVAVQQAVLDKIAEQIRNDGAFPNCQAPQLASCETSKCSVSVCGEYLNSFEIGFTSDKQITLLFALCVSLTVHGNKLFCLSHWWQ